MSDAPYICRRTSSSQPDWSRVEWSPRFADMVTAQPGFFDTRAAALWDDKNFYVRFQIEEPNVEAHLTERDSLIFTESDVELFIDGGDCYYEFEINALGTIYEVLFIWQDSFGRGSRFDVPEFDVLSRKALTFGGDYDRSGATFWRGTHPRGLRWAFLDWDFPGLQASVRVEGKINDPRTVDKGWTVDLTLPWAGMKWLANGRSLPPRDGDLWRMFFGRFQKLTPSGIEVQPHPAWCWSSHGVYDTHQPDRWTPVLFSGQAVEER